MHGGHETGRLAPVLLADGALPGRGAKLSDAAKSAGVRKRARAAVYLDETVDEIDVGVIAGPIGTKLDPIGVFAGLVETDEIAQHDLLPGLSVRDGFFEVPDGLAKIDRIEARGDLAIRCSRA